MNKRNLIGMAAVFLALSASTVLAGPHGWGRGMGPGYGMEPQAAANLNLSAEQSAKLQSLRENHLKAITPLQNQMFAMRSELRLLWNETNPDKETLMAKHKAISNLNGEIQRNWRPSTDWNIATRFRPSSGPNWSRSLLGMGGGHRSGRACTAGCGNAGMKTP
ncbi:MAG: periplasmic heavy metal sensor [Deltaproteobacteria bacterium]|nr:periplasmic heavy metal sensor [Deltaproteobacteria bacterium]